MVIILVKDDLTEICERLKKRDELYKKAVGNIDLLITLGILLVFFGFIPVIPILLNIFFNIDIKISMPISIFLGIILTVFGEREKKGRIKPPELVITERKFLNVYEALENLDTYLLNGDDFSRMEAVKILQKIDKKLIEPVSSRYEFWGVLIKDYSLHLSFLKRNLSEKLIPAINKGEQIKLAYSITEDLAEFLINPGYTELINLNVNVSNLPTVISEKEPKIPLLQKRPIIKHIIIIAFFISLSYSAYYLGPKYLHISTNTSYTTAGMMFATLTAGYMNFIRNRR